MRSRLSIPQNVMPLTLVLVFLFAAWFLISRIWGTYPSVFPDEFLHSKNARLVSLSDVEIPSYLYYGTYRIVVFFGEEFLNAARVLNTFFYLTGCYLIYHIVRYFAPQNVALLVVVFAIFSPLNTYVNYFMPESMYFFFFWLFILLVLKDRFNDSIIGNTVLGVVFGCLLLVKPHALLILPVYPISLMIVYRNRQNKFSSLVTFTIVALGLKFIIGYLFAGGAGLTLFGSVYTNQVRIFDISTIDYYYTIRSILINIGGNILALGSVYGIGFLYLLILQNPISQPDDRIRILWCMLVFILIVLVPFVSIFSTLVYFIDYNVDNRLYLRYYNYAMPVVIILIAAHLKTNKIHSWELKALGLMLLSVILYTLYHQASRPFMMPYKIRVTDTPEFYLILLNPFWFRVSMAVSILTIVIWLFNTTRGIKAFLYVYMPLFLLITNLNSYSEVKTRNQPRIADIAGSNAAQFIPFSDHGKLLVIGESELDVTRSLMYFQSKDAHYKIIDSNDTLRADSFEDTRQWFLVLGSFNTAGSLQVELWGEGFTLYGRNN